MEQIKNKRALKNIAKEWAKAILFATDLSAFNEDSILNIDEQQYVLDELHNIADKIIEKHPLGDLEDICEQYFEIN